MAEDTPIKIRSVMDICLMLKEVGHADKFVKELEERGAFVIVNNDTVNLVQDYFVKNNLHVEPFGASVAGTNPAPAAARAVRGCPDYQCPHVHNG